MANVSLDEVEIGTANTGDTLTFPNVRSCTAITVVLKSGQLVGGHYVHDQPDDSMTESSLDSNFLDILNRIQKERIRAVYSVYRKAAVKQQWGKCLMVVLISSTWGYKIELAKANINMLFNPDKLITIDVDIPAMDITFNNSNKQLAIANHKTGGAIKTFNDFSQIPAGRHEC
jgi:hypothetical protein